MRRMTFRDKETHKNGGRFPYHFPNVIDWYVIDGLYHVIYVDSEEEYCLDETITIEDIKKISFPIDNIIDITSYNV